MLTPDRNFNNLTLSHWGGFVVRAKYFERKDSPGRFVVYLDWQGKRYKRTRYDDNTMLFHPQLAQTLCAVINQDIKEKGKAFDPRAHFGYGRYELQFKTYAEKWLAEASETGRYAPSVKRDVERYIWLAIEHFKTADLRGFKQAHIKDFLKGLPPKKNGEPLGPKTKKTILGHLHTLLSDAAADYEGVVSCPHFPEIGIPDKEAPWIEEDWQDKILLEIPEWDRPIFVLMKTWGVRPGEARALKWDCIHMGRKLITIKRTFSGAGCNHLQEWTKTKRIRLLPITDELAAMFERLRKRQPITPFVFVNEHGRPYTADVSRIWNEARKRAGCPEEVTLYQGTKHSFVTQNIEELPLVQEAVGHMDQRTTRIYKGRNVEKLRHLREGK
jgi:integrase